MTKNSIVLPRICQVRKLYSIQTIKIYECVVENSIQLTLIKAVHLVHLVTKVNCNKMCSFERPQLNIVTT